MLSSSPIEKASVEILAFFWHQQFIFPPNLVSAQGHKTGNFNAQMYMSPDVRLQECCIGYFSQQMLDVASPQNGSQILWPQSQDGGQTAKKHAPMAESMLQKIADVEAQDPTAAGSGMNIHRCHPTCGYQAHNPFFSRVQG